MAAASKMLRSNFLFVLWQRGAEKALKREIVVGRLELRPAYERKGLVTFRSAQEKGPEDRVDAVLARHSGLSLGLFPDVAAVAARIATLSPPLRLHVIERELFASDQAPPDHRPGELAGVVESALRVALPDAFCADQEALPGELVLDVIVAQDDPILLGVHRQEAGRSPHPAGRYAYEVPEDAPSRAYGKLEEALRCFDLPVRAGDTALELGAAPGGAAYALLRRGVRVVGVDPGAIDERVLAFVGPGDARFVHLRAPMGAVQRNELPADVQWLFMDVHLAPQVALRATERFSAMFRGSLLGAVLTLKLNDWSFLDQVERFEASARSMGIVEPHARQLPAHRQEFALAGLTERGLRRRRAASCSTRWRFVPA